MDNLCPTCGGRGLIVQKKGSRDQRCPTCKGKGESAAVRLEDVGDQYNEAVQGLRNAAQELYGIARQVGTPPAVQDAARQRAHWLILAVEQLERGS